MSLIHQGRLCLLNTISTAESRIKRQIVHERRIRTKSKWGQGVSSAGSPIMLRCLTGAASGVARRAGGSSLCIVQRCDASSSRVAATASMSRSCRSSPMVRNIATSTARKDDHATVPHPEAPVESAAATLDPTADSRSTTTSTFTPRTSFPLPTTTPSWYAGHMARAIRSMPYLLARYPPPLVIEARDARLPLTSINPVFEQLLRKAPTANDHLSPSSSTSSSSISNTWRNRRLIVYLKRDLISPNVEASILSSLRQIDPHQSYLFIDTRSDSDVKKVLAWVEKQARIIHADDSIHRPAPSEKQERRAKKGLSGAFRHTPTPEEGVRLLILGMPNVGKSSLLNALRRVGVGKGKAASTAPHPGHTRKLTGTVRISKAGPTKEVEQPEAVRGRRSRRGVEEQQAEGEASSFVISATTSTTTEEDSEGTKTDKPADPPIYVYDTPGVMVPFLGHGASGSERGLKLAITAGIKDSLFDIQLLADYLLYQLNLRPALADTSTGGGGLPSYIQNLPLSIETYLSTCADARGRTNSIQQLLWHVAEKAPGSLRKGNVRDLDAAATFLLQHWRLGKLDANTELDLNTDDDAEIRRRIHAFFHTAPAATTPTPATHRGAATSTRRAAAAAADTVGSQAPAQAQSKTQAKKQQKASDVLARKRKLMSKGIAVGAGGRGAKKPFKRGSASGGAGGGKKKRK